MNTSGNSTTIAEAKTSDLGLSFESCLLQSRDLFAKWLSIESNANKSLEEPEELVVAWQSLPAGKQDSLINTYIFMSPLQNGFKTPQIIIIKLPVLFNSFVEFCTILVDPRLTLESQSCMCFSILPKNCYISP